MTQRRLLAPALLAAVCLLLTVLAVAELGRRAQRDAEAREERSLLILGQDLDAALEDQDQFLRGLEGLFAASDDVELSEFHSYLDSVSAMDLPGMRGVGWAPSVQRDELDDFLAERLSEDRSALGYADGFALRTDDSDRELFIVDYAEEPVEPAGAVGFDLNSEPTRRQAIVTSRATGQPVASEPVTLVGPAEERGLLVVLATDSSDSEGSGVLISALSINDLVQSANTQPDRRFELFDAGTSGATNRGEPILIYSTLGGASSGDLTEVVDRGGHEWQIRMAADDFEPGGRVAQVLAALIGLAVSAAASWWLRRIQMGQRRFEQRAEELSMEVDSTNERLTTITKRLARTAEATSVELWDLNRQTGALDVSGGNDGGTHEPTAFSDLLQLVHRDDRVQLKRTIDSIEPSMGLRSHRYRVLDRYGDYRWLHSRFVCGDGMNHEVVLGANMNITDVREQDLAESSLLNSELARTNESLRDFVRVASHDLRSPLRGIRSLIRFIRDDYDDLPDGCLDHLESMDTRVERMQALLDDLLEYTKAGFAEHKFLQVSPLALCEETVESVHVPEGFTVEVDGPDELVGLEHVPLAACIRNLVMNAINHHHLPNGVVTVDARIEDDLLCVVVTDDGPGIPKEFFEQIFEPFRSLSTTTSAPRSGLGLALVRRMADLVDGHIDVVSIEGKGSTFTLWWPMEAPKQIEGEQGEAASSDIAGGGGRRDRSGADPTIVVEGAHR